MCAVCVTVQIDNPDTAEEWRGYILTVHKVSAHTHTHTHTHKLKTHSDGLIWESVSKTLSTVPANGTDHC